MLLSIGIQTHELREPLALELAEMIDRPCELVFDPAPRGTPSPWRTYRHALETTPTDATHRLVIQDDAIPCLGFVPALERAIAARPDDLLVLFVGGMPTEHARTLLRACEAGSRWAALNSARWCPAVAVVWPTGLIGEFLAFTDKRRWGDRLTADDEIIGRWCRVAGRQPLATVPSLVQHPDDIPSLNGRRQANGRDPTRVAACFIDVDELDPMTIDWST